MDEGESGRTPAQEKFVRDLQARLRLTNAALDRYCEDRFGLRFEHLDRRLCSQLLDTMTGWDAVPADLQRFMGQLDLFAP